MTDSATKEGTERVSLRIPRKMLRRIDEIRGPYRERTSLILEIIGTYLDEYDARQKERYAQESEDYRRVLAQVRRDLGLDQSEEG